MRSRSRPLHWADIGAIALVSFGCFFASASRLGGNPKLDAVVSLFIAGTITLVAISVLAISRHRSDPWSIVSDRIPRMLAWSVSGLLSSLALAMLDSIAWPSLGFAAMAAAILLKRGSREDIIPYRTQIPIFAAGETATHLCEGVRRSTVDQRRKWLEAVLALPGDDGSLMILVEVFERSGSLLEQPLLELVRSSTPRVQARAAYYLAWFGSIDAIPQLQRVEGEAGAVASEAARRLLARNAARGERGALSVIESSSGGSLSVATGAGGLSIKT